MEKKPQSNNKQPPNSNPGLAQSERSRARYFGNRYATYTSAKDNPVPSFRLSPSPSVTRPRETPQAVCKRQFKALIGGGGGPFRTAKSPAAARRPRAAFPPPHARSHRHSRAPHRPGPLRPLRRPLRAAAARQRTGPGRGQGGPTAPAEPRARRHPPSPRAEGPSHPPRPHSLSVSASAPWERGAGGGERGRGGGGGAGG